MAIQTNGFLSGYLRSKRLGAVLPYVKSGRILDWGCGVGALGVHVDASRYVGVDIDDVSLNIAKSRFPDHRFVYPDDPLLNSENTFDAVVALALIEHVENPETWLAEIKKHLAPNGSLVLTTPHPSMQWAHELGARVGLFSAEAAEDHNVLVDLPAMETLSQKVDLSIALYRRFLMRCNQLFVLTHPHRA